MIKELSQKLNESEKIAQKLNTTNQYLESENLNLKNQLKEREIKHDNEFKNLLKNMDELLEKSKIENEGLNFDNKILQKKLKAQKQFVAELQEEKNHFRVILETKISEESQKSTNNDIQNILTKENRQLKSEIKNLEEQLQNKKKTRSSITSLRSIKNPKVIHPKNKPLKRHSVLQNMVNLKESQVMDLRTTLDELLNKHKRTKIQLKRQTSLDTKEIKKREEEIALYKKSLGSLETNLETIKEQNLNLNKDLEEKEKILKHKQFKKVVVRFVKAVFDVLEVFLKEGFLIGLFFVFLFVTAWDSLTNN